MQQRFAWLLIKKLNKGKKKSFFFAERYARKETTSEFLLMCGCLLGAHLKF